MKRVASFFISVLLILSLTVSAFAAGPIKDVDTDNFAAALKANAASKLILLDKQQLTVEKLSSLQPKSGEELKIYLTDTMFTDADGNKINADLSKPKIVTKTQLRSANLTLRRTSSKGNKCIESYGIKYDKQGAYIGVKFKESVLATEDIEFLLNLCLAVKGKRRIGTEMKVGGDYTFEEIEAERGDEYLDISGGEVVYATGPVSNIELDLGNGVTIFTNLVKGKKYVGYASIDQTTADTNKMIKYPEIENVYTLNILNIKTTEKCVNFDLDNMHVYDAQGNYLGTTNSKLPFSSKYYLSYKKYESIK